MMPARHPQRRDMVTVALLAVLALAVLSELTVWIPLAAAVAHTYGRTAASTTGWVFGTSMALGVLVTGPLADRYGRRPVLLVGLVALAAASVAAGAAPSWPVHLVARAAQGLAAASVPPVILAWVAELPAARRALGLTVVVTAMSAANPVGQLYGQWVTAAGGWRATYLGLAGAYLPAAVLLCQRLTGTPVVMRREQAGQTARRLLGILGVRPLLACWLLSGLMVGVVVAMYAGLQLHLLDVSSAPTDVLMAARIVGLAGILAGPLLLWRPLAGAPPRAKALIGVGVAMAGLVGQVLAPGSSVLVAGSLLVAVGLPLTMAPLASVIAQFAPTTARASAFAVQSAVIYLGVAAGGAAAGLVGYGALCLAAAAALAVGVLPLVLTVPASARAPASHGAWLAKPRAGALAGFSVVGAVGLVVLLGLGGQGGCGSGCNGQAGVAQTQPGSTGRSAAAGAPLGVPGASASGGGAAVGTGGGRRGSATPTISGIGIGSQTTPGGTPLPVPPATSGSGTGTSPATVALGSTRLLPASTAVPPTTAPSSTAPPTSAPASTAVPPTTAPSSTAPPTSAPASTAVPPTTAPSSTAPPTSDTTPPSSSARGDPR